MTALLPLALGGTVGYLTFRLLGGLHGLAKREGVTADDVDPRELAKGIKTELEHTRSRHVARTIALDHLTEDPKYYEKLAKAGL